MRSVILGEVEDNHRPFVLNSDGWLEQGDISVVRQDGAISTVVTYDSSDPESAVGVGEFGSPDELKSDKWAAKVIFGAFERREELHRKKQSVVSRMRLLFR